MIRMASHKSQIVSVTVLSTGVHLVPAVRDATLETADPKHSPIISLLADIARQTFENRREMADFIRRTEEEFAVLSDPARVQELSDISDLLTLPIRLTPMTATCRVPPLSRVKLGIGWSRGVARDAEQ